MKTGDIIGSRYHLTKPLQTAWLAVEQTSGQNCLIRLKKDFIDPAVAEWLGQVWHPGLPRLLETIQNNEGESCFVFEYLEGRSFNSLADAAGGRLKADLLLPLISQAARILAFIHQQGEKPVLHLDIKPDHLLLDEFNRVFLIDFGAARFMRAVNDAGAAADGSGLTANVRIALTPDYAAPELSAGRPCPGSDLFALGMCLLQLLTGQPAAICRSQPLPDLAADLPDGLQRLIGRCLQSDPAVRYNAADELACDLEKIETDLLANAAAATDLPPASAESPAGQLPAPLLCVWAGAEFGCELSAVLSRRGRIIVIDADLLNPQADALLGLRKAESRRAVDKALSGLDLVLTEEQRGHLDITRLNRMIQPTRIAGVGALTSQTGLDHYEHFHLDSLNQVLRLARLISDLVIVLCSRFVFDAFTCLCLQTATRIIVPLTANSAAFRECRRSIDYLAARQQLELEKLAFAAFDYNPKTDLSRGTLDALCDGRLAGCITGRDRRRSMKNGALPYAASLDQVNISEYRSLIRRIGLLESTRKEAI